MDIQKEREAFENWWESFHNGRQISCDYVEKDNSYAVGYANAQWVAWQAKAQAVPEWISVEDSLPKKNANVLLNVVARRRGKPFSCIGFYSVEPDDEPCFILDDNFTILKGVTHWMQLPQAPKAQEP